MSIVEVNDAGNPHPDELIQSSSNEQISCSYNRTRSVQYPHEYESASHIPKRNWKKTPDFNIGIDQHPSKLNHDNIAFAVEPYLPPTRILRCYNCQVYDDHIAAHCPNKDNTVCFRCAQHHPYNSNCYNVIKYAHCQGDHMVGDPSCSIKSGKRQEKNQRLKILNGTSTSTAQQQHKQVWSGN
ncbi:unnamed protein product [Rotaria sp. Silwood1]|nr:unnamed protein product [Rotaria sp. Silwood1]